MSGPKRTAFARWKKNLDVVRARLRAQEPPLVEYDGAIRKIASAHRRASRLGAKYAWLVVDELARGRCAERCAPRAKCDRCNAARTLEMSEEGHETLAHLDLAAVRHAEERVNVRLRDPGIDTLLRKGVRRG